MKDMYAMDNLKTPTDIFGADYFNKTFGDFFKYKIFGGMWDSARAHGVLEFKTNVRRTGRRSPSITHYRRRYTLICSK